MKIAIYLYMKVILFLFLAILAIFAGCSSDNLMLAQNASNNADSNVQTEENEPKESSNEVTLEAAGKVCEYTKIDENNKEQELKYYQKGSMLRIDDLNKSETMMVIKNNVTYINLPDEDRENLEGTQLADCDWLYFEGDSNIAEDILTQLDVSLNMTENIENTDNNDLEHKCSKEDLSDDLFKTEGKTCDYMKIMREMMSQYQQIPVEYQN